MKSTTINLRIDQATKNALDAVSANKNVTASEFIREALSQHIENEDSLDPDTAETKNGIHLVKTIGFVEFIFWLYHKAIDPEISEIRGLYIQFIELINECKKHPLFDSELIREFDKVLIELEREVNGENFNTHYFSFSNSENGSFDYEILARFMYTLRYDSDDNLIIHCK